MINAIINASLRDRFMVLIATVIIALVGLFAYKNAPLDAIPDLSDVQVIIFTEYPGQSPQVVEDQVTYPLTTSMLAVPRTKVVRGYSFFGLSFVYIIFEDGTDMYWARSRVLESINYVSGRLPQGITPTLGPDATGVGWIYEYALVDKTGKHDLAQLRSLQDWYLRYPLQTVEGVSEVASVGGYVKQYQVEVDPNALLRYNIPLNKIRMAIKMSNRMWVGVWLRWRKPNIWFGAWVMCSRLMISTVFQSVLMRTVRPYVYRMWRMFKLALSCVEVS